MSSSLNISRPICSRLFSSSRSQSMYKRRNKHPKANRKTSEHVHTNDRILKDEAHLWHDDTFRISILGRPNVGKSTLFNQLRLRTEPKAIVHASAGVTRDRILGKGFLGTPIKKKKNKHITRTNSDTGLHFYLTDTAGLELEKGEEDYDWDNHTQLINDEMLNTSLQTAMLNQSLLSVQNAHVILFMFDAKVGVTSMDIYFSKWLRRMIKSNQHVIVLANKSDSNDSDDNIMEAYQLGFGEPVLLSAIHGDGFAQLHMKLQEIYKQLNLSSPEIPIIKQQEPISIEEIYNNNTDTDKDTNNQETKQEKTKQIDLSIVGKPNVGKSTLINALLGDDRLLVGDQPGITRDAIKTSWSTPKYPNYAFQIMDTAGLKTTSKDILNKSPFSDVDNMSMKETLHIIDYSEVVCLTFDASDNIDNNIDLSEQYHNKTGRKKELSLEQCISKVRNVLSAQDLAIARTSIDEGRALILIANKWDLIPKEQQEGVLLGLKTTLLSHLPQVKDVSIITMSALYRTNLHLFASTVITAYEKWNIRINTGILNRWLTQLISYQPPAKVNGKQVRIRYISQVNSRPPRFVIFCNRPNDLSESYMRFLTNTLRKEFDLEGVPIRIFARSGSNPFANNNSSSLSSSSSASNKKRIN